MDRNVTNEEAQAFTERIRDAAKEKLGITVR